MVLAMVKSSLTATFISRELLNCHFLTRQAISPSLISSRQVDECTSETVASAESNSETDDETLFTCPEEGCVKTFQRFSSLHKHLDGGSHKYALERESLLHKAMLRYAENLESGASSIEENVEAIISEEYEEVSFAKGKGLLRGDAYLVY